MRLLFAMDTKDYNPSGSAFVRPSVRAVIRSDGLLAMVYSRKYDYYKFPGGGIEHGETRLEALRREVKEETGLVIAPETVREYGYVHRVEKGDPEDFFVQDNFYYLCEAATNCCSQDLDDYEADEGFTLQFVSPETAITVNRTHDHGPKSARMLEREARVLEYLQKEGLL